MPVSDPVRNCVCLSYFDFGRCMCKYNTVRWSLLILRTKHWPSYAVLFNTQYWLKWLRLTPFWMLFFLYKFIRYRLFIIVRFNTQTLLCKFWATQCQKVSMGRYRLNFFTDFRVIDEKNSNALCKLYLANIVIIISVFHSKEVWIPIWYVIWNE